MMDLLEVQDDLRIIRLQIECAFMACDHLKAAEPIGAVLYAASEKLRELGEAIEAICNGPRDWRHSARPLASPSSHLFKCERIFDNPFVGRIELNFANFK